MNSQKQFIVLTVLWILCVIPFIHLGFGSDGDAWRVAEAAGEMWRTGAYVKSRTTGFPMFELAVTPLIISGSWYLSNLFSFVAGISFLLAIWQLHKAGIIKSLFSVTLLAAFIPVFVKNAASTMDYIPALSLLMWSFYLLIRGKFLWCGILIGLASGFRPTSIMFLFPAAIYLLSSSDVDRKKIILLFTSACLTFLVAYSPALIRYGFPDPFGRIGFGLKSRILNAGYYALGLYGVIPTVLMILISCIPASRIANSNPAQKRLQFFYLAVITTFSLLFLIMPDEPEYLLPIVPFVALFIDSSLRKKYVWILIGFVLSYHLIRLETLGGESGQREITLQLKPGYTIRDVQLRRALLGVREAATRYQSEQPVVLMYGQPHIVCLNEQWVFDEKYEMHRQKKGNLFVSGRIRDEQNMKRLKDEGFRLIVARESKWEYYTTGNEYWQNYVEVVDNVQEFLGIKSKIIVP